MTIHNVDNLISLAGTINVVNDDVAVITGVTSGLIAPQFNTANNTFSYFNNGGSSLNVSDDQVLFYLNVLLTGTQGQSTLLEFVNTPLPIEGLV
ncbi:MAG: hypothetical protein R2795_05290 [Saprospiraceae bacterium]